MKEMKAYWGGMLKEELPVSGNTIEETGTRHLAMYGRPYGKSLCHAWGASPIYLLGKYYLGVKPPNPVTRNTPSPCLGGLKWMEGTVPLHTAISISIWIKKRSVSSPTAEGSAEHSNPERNESHDHRTRRTSLQILME